MIRSAFLAVLFGVLPLSAQDDNKVLGKTLPEWLTMLRSGENPRFRRAALIALEVYGPKHPGVLLTIIDALKTDKDDEVRRVAAQTLGRMGPDARTAVEALGQALQKDKADAVREAAARALGGTMIAHSHTQVPALAAALSDRHAGARAAAAHTLLELEDKSRGALPLVTKAMEDTKLDDYTRIYAAQLLGRLGRGFEPALPTLTKVAGATDDQPKVRQSAIDGLANLAEDAKPSAAVLVKVLQEDKSLDLRLAAAAALHRVDADPKQIWPAVKAAVAAEQPGLRHQAIRLAGRVAATEPDAIPLLAALADKDDNTENRLAAIDELAELGAIAKAALPTLQRLAQNDGRASIRDAAQAAMKRITE